MRKVIFGGANSLDNYFARKDGSVDWLMFSEDVAELMKDMWPRVDVMLMGRKTWVTSQEQFTEEELEEAAKMNAGFTTYVFSRSLPAGPAKGNVEIVNADAAEFVRELKTQPGKDIMVMGGGELARSLFEAGVIDEIGFNIHPVLLGAVHHLLQPLGGHAIHADHASLILDRPSLQQRQPVLLPLHRPQRDDDEKIRAPVRRRAEDFGKPQIVTNERRGNKTGAVERDDLAPGLMALRFTAEAERMNLRVAREQFAGR